METINVTFEDTIWKALQEVKDPEIPVISVVDLGIISDLDIGEDGQITISMSPTFTGCPALDFMKEEIKKSVESVEGVASVIVNVDFSTTWTSNLISETGRKQLKDFGFAPPPKHNNDIDIPMLENVACPYCDSSNTSLNSPFGPTLCRSLHYCHNCKQAFQQFKPI